MFCVAGWPLTAPWGSVRAGGSHPSPTPTPTPPLDRYRNVHSSISTLDPEVQGESEGQCGPQPHIKMLSYFAMTVTGESRWIKTSSSVYTHRCVCIHHTPYLLPHFSLFTCFHSPPLLPSEKKHAVWTADILLLDACVMRDISSSKRARVFSRVLITVPVFHSAGVPAS